jgi:hypothetical protein
MSYYEKYLKYKNKYLRLKELIGGESVIPSSNNLSKCAPMPKPSDIDLLLIKGNFHPHTIAARCAHHIEGNEKELIDEAMCRVDIHNTLGGQCSDKNLGMESSNYFLAVQNELQKPNPYLGKNKLVQLLNNMIRNLVINAEGGFNTNTLGPMQLSKDPRLAWLYKNYRKVFEIQPIPGSPLWRFKQASDYNKQHHDISR